MPSYKKYTSICSVYKTAVSKLPQNRLVWIIGMERLTKKRKWVSELCWMLDVETAYIVSWHMIELPKPGLGDEIGKLSTRNFEKGLPIN